MNEQQYNSVWRVIGTSVRGALHERTGRPNQDAIIWYPETGTGTPLILAVSDGHGSAKSFRSREGADIAVSTAIRIVQQFLEGQPDMSNHTAIKRTAEEKLPQVLVRTWRQEVQRHLVNHPFTEAEPAGNNPFHAYGATLLTVLVAPSFLLYLQLGDGDILCVADSGEVVRPLLRDERLFANETTSLCLDAAWNDFQVVFQVVSAHPPALVLVSTDGYANSFSKEEDFLKVGSDILNMVRSDGLDAIRDSLEEWLTEASEGGSGDDITLGIICRTSEEQIR